MLSIAMVRYDIRLREVARSIVDRRGRCGDQASIRTGESAGVVA